MITGIQFPSTSAIQSIPSNGASNANSPSSGPGFGTFLQQALDNANTTMNQANADAASYAVGGPVSIQQMMIAEQQANIAVDTIDQVEKRVVSDYQTVMNMSV